MGHAWIQDCDMMDWYMTTWLILADWACHYDLCPS